jgi:DNA-binding transcriptional LysR family regulator
MHKMDLNQLIDLDALLSTGSVSGAAKRLHISAPAMSRRLSHLREALGDPLFVLAGRRMVPTERALALRERVQAVIEDVRGILAPPEVNLATLKRTLTLRANDGFAGVWAARLITRISAEAPGVRLRFKPRAEKDMEALRSGEVDLDNGVLDTPAPEIKSQTLIRAPFVGVVRADHPLLKKRRIDVEQFIRWPHISASRRGHANGPIDEALRSLGKERHIAVFAQGFQAALIMAAHSDLIAAMPAPFAQWGAEYGAVRQFPLPISTPEVEIALSWHPRLHADPVHCWLRAHVRATTNDAWKVLK